MNTKMDGVEGSLFQNMYERGGSEGCFVFTSWLIRTFDFYMDDYPGYNQDDSLSVKLDNTISKQQYFVSFNT